MLLVEGNGDPAHGRWRSVCKAEQPDTFETRLGTESKTCASSTNGRSTTPVAAALTKTATLTSAMQSTTEKNVPALMSNRHRQNPTEEPSALRALPESPRRPLNPRPQRRLRTQIRVNRPLKRSLQRNRQAAPRATILTVTKSRPIEVSFTTTVSI